MHFGYGLGYMGFRLRVRVGLDVQEKVRVLQEYCNENASPFSTTIKKAPAPREPISETPMTISTKILLLNFITVDPRFTYFVARTVC